MESKYNLKSPGVKRLMREACELAEPTEEYYACPLEDNLFEWHFTVRGPPNTEFEGGFYHGRILLPSQYPMQPPHIILLTPNGRFEVNKKICLSISGYHPESWQPSWSIRTALLALIVFMPTSGTGTIGALDYSSEERQTLAKKSRNWECSVCGKISEKLSTQSKPKLTQEETSLLEQIKLKAEEETQIKPKNEEEANSNVNESKESLNETADENEENSTIRQRINANQEQIAEVFYQAQVTALNQNNLEKSWNIIVWILLSAIAILILRRLFFV